MTTLKQSMIIGLLASVVPTAFAVENDPACPASKPSDGLLCPDEVAHTFCSYHTVSDGRLTTDICGCDDEGSFACSNIGEAITPTDDTLLPPPTTQPILESCPLEKPEFGSQCAPTFTDTCRYNPYNCPGTDHVDFIDNCACIQGQIECVSAMVICNEKDEDLAACPDDSPSHGDSCDIDSDVQCKYEPFGCPASDNPPTFLKSCQCNPETNTYECSTATPLPCDFPDTGFPDVPVLPEEPAMGCPVEKPGAGDACVAAENCEYNMFQCPGQEEAFAADTCDCVDGQFLCMSRSVNCEMGPVVPDEPPVEICPFDKPSTGDRCFATQPCDYNFVMCPGEDEAVAADTCECVDGQFICFARGISCPEQPVVPIEPPVEICPFDKPSVGDRCFATQPCDYNFVMCPGEDEAVAADTCECVDGQFICLSRAISCPQQPDVPVLPPPLPPVEVCPADKPTTGDKCSAAEACDYNFVTCPGQDTKIAADSCLCVEGQFICMARGIMCGADEEDPEPPRPQPTCPFTMPSAGDSCALSPAESCDYNPTTCPGQELEIAADTCQCDNGVFVCMSRRVVCPDSPTTPPAPEIGAGQAGPIPTNSAHTECPADAPSPGDSCTAEMTSCSYNPFTCPGGDLETFITTCSCDSLTNQVVCAEAFIMCPGEPTSSASGIVAGVAALVSAIAFLAM